MRIEESYHSEAEKVAVWGYQVILASGRIRDLEVLCEDPDGYLWTIDGDLLLLEESLQHPCLTRQEAVTDAVRYLEKRERFP